MKITGISTVFTVFLFHGGLWDGFDPRFLAPAPTERVRYGGVEAADRDPLTR